MKKSWIGLALLIVLAGCSGQKTEESSSETAVSTTNSANASTSSIRSTSTESSTETTKESEPVSSTTNSEAQADASKELMAQFPQTNFPSDIPYDGQALNIASDGNNQKISVLYYSMDQPLILNHRQLNQETPFASYRKEIFKTSQMAKEAVNAIYDTGGQKIDLGYGITGYKQGAAGSTYLNWREGNWALVVRASNVEGQSPDAIAKKIVTYLEKAFLPAPKETGQISVDQSAQGYQANQVIWQEDTIVYTVTHEDALSALAMAVSMEK
ncbi:MULTISPECIES: hypothetical protein [Enterococcus]|uniref:hypothetical protein n=1 Tax=Enterococcus TaxID=1350 RepID=UPI0010F71F13|nr:MULTISPECIES: hypothetical protein [Enterococcus]KAF1300813.1 hypothetical protein BAU16_12080 [Enterococcus sp. JM9B]